jgi:asparagine synthase (glutamine-hydrolysing)
MGSLFGYCGPSAHHLIGRMAERLSHRADRGHEQVAHTSARRTTCCFGHGRTRWNRPAQVAGEGGRLLAYSGVLFQPCPEATEGERPPQGPIRLLRELDADPAGQLSRLDGSFVLAWADEDQCLLLRDASGIKVLYWTLVEGRLLFASEIKALFCAPGFSRRLRPHALAEYFAFSFVPGERTMLEGVFELQPGSMLRFREGQVDIRRWFRFEEQEYDPARPMSDGEAAARVRQALLDSTADCLAVAQQPAGCFLSGGIDSSAVLAAAAQLRPDEPLPTYSIHFGEEYPHENSFIELMTRRYGTVHRQLEVRPDDFSDRLAEMVWRLDDPIGDPVSMPNYLLAAMASADTPVVLNGEGGDPCLGGPKNIPMLLASLYGPPPDEPLDGFLERQYLRSFERGYLDFRQLLSPRLRGQIPGDEGLVALLRPFFGNPVPRAFVNRLMAMNIRLKGANLILVKVDKMTSANGLLALAPLFSRRMIETSFLIPPQSKLRGNVEKAVLKMAVADWVPPEIIMRPKSGMRVPVHYWFQRELRRFAKKHLSRRRLKRLDLFDPDYVAALLAYDSERVPARRHGLKLWMLITFLLWYEQFIMDEG